MKGLDTPVLLGLLEGAPKARALVWALADEELATTEVNLFEIELLGRREKSPGRARRMQALERLRRRLTVLPIDEETTRRAAAIAASARQTASEGTWLCVGAAEAHGCTEWITNAAGMPPASAARIKITDIERWKSK
jgi:predicted nucleic acid-binding protein